MLKNFSHISNVAEKSSNAKPKLLIVEDNQLNRMVTKLYLKDYYEIDEASDGKSAISMVCKKQFDMILMDINLGLEMDGIETMSKIRFLKGFEKIPIVAVTAYAMAGDREKFLEAGFTDYISKPLKIDSFASFIQKNLTEVINL